MKIILIISYLIGGIFIPIQLDKGSLPADQAAADRVEHVIEVIDDTSSQPILLTSVNDITLYDDAADVIEKKGAPQQVTTDSEAVEYIVYEYANMTVNFQDQLVDYVEISNEATTLWLDQTEIPATIEAIKAALGEPDYTAEDGIVFQRNEALLKLFIDPNNGELETIAYYHIAST